MRRRDPPFPPPLPPSPGPPLTALLPPAHTTRLIRSLNSSPVSFSALTRSKSSPDMARPLKVGVQLPEVERVVRWSELREMARTAEAIGLDSIWVGDHLLYRGDGRPPRGPWEAWTTLAAIAAVTERVELGPLVAATTFHNAGDAGQAGSDGRRDQRRSADPGPGRRLERGRISRLRLPVRPSGQPLRGGVHDHPDPAGEGRCDFHGTLLRPRDCELMPRGPARNGGVRR